jgi:hypothetical protein
LWADDHDHGQDDLCLRSFEKKDKDSGNEARGDPDWDNRDEEQQTHGCGSHNQDHYVHEGERVQVQHGTVPANVLYLRTIVRSTHPAGKVIRKDRLSHRGDATGVKCAAGQIHSGILDLLYSAIQSFTEVASERLELTTSALNRSWAYITEVVKVMNKTKYAYMSTTKPCYGRGRGGHGAHPLIFSQVGGLQGLYMMAIFLACGFVLTFGWGVITPILVVVPRAGLGKQLQEAREPEDSSKEAGSAKDVSISTSGLRHPT